MKLLVSLLLISVAADIVICQDEEPVEKAASIEEFFQRLYPPKPTQETLIREQSNYAFKLPDVDIPFVLDISDVMDKAGNAMVNGLTKGIQQLLETILKLVKESGILDSIIGGLGGGGRFKNNVFHDADDLLAFGKRLQAVSDQIFDNDFTDEHNLPGFYSNFDSKVKEDLFNLIVSWIVEFRKAQGQFRSNEKPNIVGIFEKVLNPQV